MTSMAMLRTALAEDGMAQIVPGSIPAPVWGWNERDSLNGMDPRFAVRLDNFFPYNGYVTLREGSRQWIDGLGGEVRTLAYWADGTTEKVLAGAGGQIWEVTDGGKISLGTGFSNNDWQWVQTKGTRTATAATARTYLLNGVDTAQVYNGTILAAVTWTAAAGGPALDLTKLQNAAISKDVLFVAEKNELGFWHSAKGQVGPAVELTWFDLGTILPNGGELLAIARYTVEGGEGPDDYTVFIASTGWVAVYVGGDPSQATDWALTGVYNLGPVLGKRCVLEAAGDVIILTVNGYVSLRQFIKIGGLQQQAYVFNDNIQPEVVRQTRAYRSNFGWQAVLVPGLTFALFNVPVGTSAFEQHIVNTQTAAWARLKNWNGLCWLATNNDLLFGTKDGTVVSANEGDTDVGAQRIEGDAITAFSYFGQPGLRKLFQMYRPLIEIAGSAAIRLGLAVDFDERAPLIGPSVTSPTNAAQWNTATWNTAVWGGASRTELDWRTIGRLGYSAAVRMNVISAAQLVNWKGTDINFTPGGTL